MEIEKREEVAKQLYDKACDLFVVRFGYAWCGVCGVGRGIGVYLVLGWCIT